MIVYHVDGEPILSVPKTSVPRPGDLVEIGRRRQTETARYQVEKVTWRHETGWGPGEVMTKVVVDLLEVTG